MNILDFARKKQAAEKIVMVTCYDYLAAKLVETSEIDCVLIGDSVAMVVHGFQNTTMATMAMMELHTQAVARAICKKFIIADLPFLAYRQSLKQTVKNVQCLIQAGAQAVKLEGCEGNLDTISYLVASGVPVMGHLGMTPQSVNLFGGHKVQANNATAATTLLAQAQQLQQAGCFALVLECIPATLAGTVTQQLTIPTIGIGAGPNTDGQVLVWHDMLGMQHDFNPKFLKRYTDSATAVHTALNQYAFEVKHGQYPVLQHHSY